MSDPFQSNTEAKASEEERPEVGGEADAGRHGLERSVNVGPQKWGRGPLKQDARKFRYDVYAAQGESLSIAVTKDDRMSAEEAGDMLHRIHVTFGVARESESRLAAFDKALFFCHTLNGGSILQPGRAKFVVDGVDIDFIDIIRILGPDVRRFFRAFADDIAEVNKQVIKSYDPYDHIASEQYGCLMQVAGNRGLHKHPHLAHDSADACNNLTPSERSVLAASKKDVISTSVNSADSMRANPRVLSADKFDSTNLRSL